MLVNRVAYGGERIILTSRGRPKAALVSMLEYERLVETDAARSEEGLEAWLAGSDRLAVRIAEKQTAPYDADHILEEARADLEERHNYLRGD